MIQIRKIRLLRDGITAHETELPQDILVTNHAELFSKIDTVISKIPEHERYNLFYTRGATPGGPKRKWYGRQDVIPFDIDKIRVIDGTENPEFEPDIESIITAVFDAIKADRNKSIVVSSGNGVQILIQPERSITDEKFFIDYAQQYQMLCVKINETLRERGLTGEADSTVFSINGIFRLPGTENRKPEKNIANRPVVLINGKLEPQPFEICPPPEGLENSEPWKVKKGDAVSAKFVAYSKLDEPSIEGGCEFLKAAKESPGSMSEAQWYAMLSVVGRFTDPEKVHAYSEGHPSYSRSGTDGKTKQALQASGPRTCENIDRLWGQCSTCAFYGKVPSPVSIKGDGFIATEASGFHSVSKSGGLTPEPWDLQAYFQREHRYVVSSESEAVFVYDGKKYARWTDTELRAFADANFKPSVPERSIQEFRHAVTRRNLYPEGFFENSVKGYVNFQNGVYSVKDKKLIEHSPSFGFLYVLPFDYKPEDKAPSFDRFLAEFTCQDKELQLVIKEFLGYAICDEDYTFQKCLVLLGKGSNGKSTFFKLINLLLGEKNISHLSLEDLSSVTAKSALEGKLINLCDELPNDKFGESNSFKNLFGGTTQVRKLYKDAQTIRNMAKFIFSGNEMPHSKDTTDGFLRRLTFVPCNAIFEDGVNADPKIVKKMERELPGIFNSVMLAFEAAKEKGKLSDSKAGQEIHQSYRNAIDPIRAWFEENVFVTDKKEGYATVPDLFYAYLNYCDQVNERQRPNRAAFMKKLEPRVPEFKLRLKRVKTPGQKEKVYILNGVKLSEAHEEEEKITPDEEAMF